MGALTTETTTDKNAGGQLLDVESSARFKPGDKLGVMLASGDVFRVVLMTVPSAEQLELTLPLPAAVAAGSVITNYSAVSQAQVE